MKTLGIFVALAPITAALVSPAFAEDTVVIKHRGNSAYGHQQWHHGVALGHRDRDMTTGTVHKKVIIKQHGDGSTTKKVITHTEN